MEKKKLRWTQEALEDLQKILIYVAQQSPFVAEKVGNEIYERSVMLRDFPRIGTPFRFHGRKYCRLTIKGYYLVYEIIPDEIVVRTVFRATRDLRRALLRLDEESNA